MLSGADLMFGLIMQRYMLVLQAIWLLLRMAGTYQSMLQR